MKESKIYSSNKNSHSGNRDHALLISPFSCKNKDDSLFTVFWFLLYFKPSEYIYYNLTLNSTSCLFILRNHGTDQNKSPQRTVYYMYTITYQYMFTLSYQYRVFRKTYQTKCCELLFYSIYILRYRRNRLD